MIKIKSFMFRTGYVESQSLACLLLTHNTGFNTVQEALQDIDRLLRGAARDPRPFSACCKKTLEKQEDAEFCSKCGTSLAKEEVDTGTMFFEHIHATCNDAEYWDAFTDSGWSHDTKDFDWPNHVAVEKADELITESTTKAWDKNGKPPHGGAWKTTSDYASYHVSFFNPKMKNQILKG